MKNLKVNLRRLLKAVPVVVAMALPAPCVWAATFYVSNSGSDTNSGSEVEPFASIQRGVSLAQPGDTVLVQAGVYQSPPDVQTVRNGLPAERILIRANGGVTNLTRFIIGHSDITIDGFTFTGTNCPRFQGFVTIKSSVERAQVVNNSFLSLGSEEVKIWGILFVSGGPRPEQSAQSCLVSNNVFDTSVYQWVSLFGRQHMVANNRFSGPVNDFFRINGAFITIRGNYCTGGGIGHSDLWQVVSTIRHTSTNIVIEGNVFDNCDSQICQMESANWKSITNLTHEGTTAAAAFSSGHFFQNGDKIEISGAAPEIYNGNFLIYEVTDTGFKYDLPTDPMADATGASILAVNTVDVRDWTIQNNVFHEVHYHANILIPETKWYNNVFWHCTTNVGYVLPCTGSGSGRANGTRIINNAFVGCGSISGNDPARGWYNIQSDLTNVVTEYNFVANLDYTPKTQGQPPSTYVWWEEFGINGGDPGFVSPGSLDFRLKPDSPLVVTPTFQLPSESNEDGTFQLRFEGRRLGLKYAVEESTNLTQWNHLAVVTNVTGQAQFLVQSTGNSSRSFYRLKWVP